MAILAAATSRGERVALVDTFDLFDPESAAAAGVDLPHMLWVRGDPCAPAFPHMANRQAGEDRAITRALKATNLILQSGVFGVMALDLADAPPQALRRVPMTTWLRFQRVLEGQGIVGVVMNSVPISRSAGGVSISLRPRDSGFPSTRVTASSLGTGGIPLDSRDREFARGRRDSGDGIREKAWDRRAPARQAGAGVIERDSASGIGDAKPMFRGLESEIRTARARLVPGADVSPVRLRVSA
jgi:hypothetical protein